MTRIRRTRYLTGGIQIFLILTLITILFAGCAANKNAGTQQLSNPPQIPPQSTFIMDFSNFNQAQLSISPVQTPVSILVTLSPGTNGIPTMLNSPGSRSNWIFAALNVGFWNLVGTLGLAIPVAAFVQSIKQTPARQSDNSWIWTYSLTVQGVTYTAKLQGKYNNSGVRWDMYVTKQGEYTDFPWYYGESNSANTQGYWILKENPANPNDLLRIDWHRNPAEETGDIKYTNIVPGGVQNGGYILFEVTNEQPYDRSYVIYNKGKNETTDIEWNFSTKAGRVKDTIHFNNNDWHYWDSTLQNSSGS